LDFLSLKNDVNVPSKSNKLKTGFSFNADADPGYRSKNDADLDQQHWVQE
jgi:hypothetical protein